MKKYLILLSCFCAFALNDLLAAPPSYIQTKDSVRPDLSWNGIPSKNILTLKTKKLTTVDLKTGIPGWRSHSL